METFIANKTDIVKALRLVAAAVHPKPILPLLGFTRLQVNKDIAILSATNYEIGIKTQFMITNGSVFDTAVPGKLLLDLVNNLQSDAINFQYNTVNATMEIVTDKSKNKLNCMRSDDYPEIDYIDKFITVNTKVFKEAVERVATASGVNHPNALLNCVLLELKDGKLIMFAADGFRLAYEEIEFEGKADDFYAVISSTSIQTLARFFDESNDKLLISYVGSQIRFQCGLSSYFSNTMSGQMPDYRMFKAPEPKTIVEVDTLQMLRACKQIELFAPDDNYSTFGVSGVHVHISSFTPEKGDGRVDVAAKIESDGPIEVGLNIAFAKQFIEVCIKDQFIVEMTGPRNMIKFSMKDYPNYYYLIMPMAVKENTSEA